MNGLTERYQLLNSSFDNRFVFQLGRGSGYCAEMIGLLKALQMCLCTQTQLCLGRTSKPSGYAYKDGWDDYFLPVFTHVDGIFLQQLNRPYFPFDNKISLLRNVSRLILQATSGNNYYMFDELPWTYSEQMINKELSIHGNYWAGIQQLIHAIFRYRKEVEDGICELKSSLGFSSNQAYVAIHIRRGDKITEAPHTELAQYVKALNDGVFDTMPIYVATDDHSTVKDLRKLLGANFNIIDPIKNSIGYDQARFNAKTSQRRWEETLFFLFELDMMINSQVFLGSSPSNVFYWVRYNRANMNLIDVANL